MKKYKIILIENFGRRYISSEYDTVNDVDQAIDIIYELKCQGFNAFYEEIEKM